MMVTYSRLKGLPVIAGDGRVLGRILDVILTAEGEDLVVQDLLVVPSRLALLAARFMPRPRADRVPAYRIVAVQDHAVYLEA